jgi:hypothetical protein
MRPPRSQEIWLLISLLRAFGCKHRKNQWSDSTNGKVWALNGKRSRPGKITLLGHYFNYVMNKK